MTNRPANPMPTPIPIFTPEAAVVSGMGTADDVGVLLVVSVLVVVVATEVETVDEVDVVLVDNVVEDDFEVVVVVAVGASTVVYGDDHMLVKYVCSRKKRLEIAHGILLASLETPIMRAVETELSLLLIFPKIKPTYIPLCEVEGHRNSIIAFWR